MMQTLQTLNSDALWGRKQRKQVRIHIVLMFFFATSYAGEILQTPEG